MLKISYEGCLGLSHPPTLLSQFAVEMCAVAKNCEKNSLKPSFFWGGGFKVIDVDKSKKPVNSACYDMQQICTYLQPFSH